MEKIDVCRFFSRSISFPTFTVLSKQTIEGIKFIFFESSIKMTFSPIFIEQTEFVVPKSMPKHLEVKGFLFGSSMFIKFISV